MLKYLTVTRAGTSRIVNNPNVKAAINIKNYLSLVDASKLLIALKNAKKEIKDSIYEIVNLLSSNN